MNRREFLLYSACGASTALWAGQSRAEGAPASSVPPHIVYILADDMGYGDVSALNPECKIPTPNMDRVAREGMVFTDAHSGSAVCTPTRYGILTGRYCWRSRLKNGVLYGYDQALVDPERLTVAGLLRKQGYRTAGLGKWHLGLDWATTEGAPADEKAIDYTKRVGGGPADLGFDYFFGIPASLDMPPYVYVENDHVEASATGHVEERKGMEFYRGGPAAPGFKHEDVLPRLTEKAVACIEGHASARLKTPLFLYFALPAPHTPILPTPEFQGKSGIGPYGDFVHQVDWTIGQVLGALEKAGMAENTLFVVTSDNGCSPMADFKHLAEQGHHPSYVFRGHKADIFEGGHRIPLLVRWPARVKAGSKCDDLVCLTDLMATAAELTGYALPDNAGEDSVSMLSALSGAEKPARDTLVHHSINGSFAIRQGKWKLEFCPGSGGWSEPRPAQARKLKLPRVQLYNLQEDIDERWNLEAKYPEIVARLTALMEKQIAQGRSTPGTPQTNEGEPPLWVP